MASDQPNQAAAPARPVRRRRLRGLAARLALLGAGLAVALTVGEVVFRIAGLGPSHHRPSVEELILPVGAEPVRAPFGYIPFSIVRSTYDSDPRGYFGPGNRIDHIHNSIGWRDREHDLAKPDGTLRILGLGDSYLWGQGVRRDDTMLSRLQRRLDRELDGTTVEAVNSAVFGTNTTHQLASFAGAGVHYDPDVVLLVFVPNDVNLPPRRARSSRIDFFRNYTRIYLDPDAVDLPSRFIGWGWQIVLRDIRARRYVKDLVDGFSTDNPGVRECRQALGGIAELCRSNDVPLVVALFPFLHRLDGAYPFRPIHRVVGRWCAELGVTCIDLAAAFPGCRGPELWVHPTDQHPNERAHELAADALVGPIRDALVSRSRPNEPPSTVRSGAGPPE